VIEENYETNPGLDFQRHSRDSNNNPSPQIKAWRITAKQARSVLTTRTHSFSFQDINLKHM
jgi:hypothetical protein